MTGINNFSMKSLSFKNSIYFQKDLIKNYNDKINLNIIINSLCFLLFFIIFFLYQLKFLSINLGFDIVISSLVLVIFVVSALNLRLGFYIYIFLLPLVNSMFVFFNLKITPVIFFLSFPLILGLFVNKSTLICKKGSLPKLQKIWFDEELIKPLFIFIIIIIMSTLITTLRYANFWPFFTNNYHLLKVSIQNGPSSTDAIFLVLKNFFNYIVIIGVFAVSINCFTKIKEIVNALLILVCATALSSIFALIQKIVNPSLGNFEPWISSGRLNATFTDPNSLGAYAVLLFPIFLIIIFYFKQWYLKIIFLIFLILFLLMAFFSGTRSALVGILFELLIFLIFGLVKLARYLKNVDKKKRIIIKSTIIFLLLTIVLSSLYIVFTNNNIKSYLHKSGSTAIALESIESAIAFTKQAGITEGIKSISNYRYFFWLRSYQMGRDYPFSGIGLGAFTTELPDYHWRYDRGFNQIDDAANYFLQLFAELGIPGAVLMLVIFVLIIRKYILYSKFNKKQNYFDKNYLIIISLFISVVTMIITLFFHSYLNSIEVHIVFWVIIGLIISYIFIKKKEITKNLENSVIALDMIKLADNFKLKINKMLGRKFHIRLLLIYFLNTLGIIIITFIFTFNFIISSIGPLSIYGKQDISEWPAVSGANTFGFYLPQGYGEDSPRFTETDASICLEKKGSILTFALKAVNPDVTTNPLYVKVYMDYKLVKTFKLSDSNWHKYKFKVLQNSINFLTLTLVNSRTWSEKDWGKSDDDRELGVLFGDLGFIK